MSLMNINTGVEAPPRQQTDIPHQEPTLDPEEMEWIKLEPANVCASPKHMMRGLIILNTKLNQVIENFSTLPEHIKEENEELIQEIHRKYTDVTTREIISFNQNAEKTEQKFYEKLEQDIKRLDQMVERIESSRKKLFKFNAFKRFMFWFGCFTNICTFSVLLALILLNHL